MAASVAAYYEVQWRLKGVNEKWSASYRVAPTGEIVVKGLGRNDDYEFRVRSVSSCGARSIWVGNDYTVPVASPLPQLPPPIGSGHSDGVSVDWGDGNVPRGDVMYQIDRAPAVAPYASDPPPEADPSWVRVATVAATNWTDSLTDTAHYWYRVRAVSYTGAISDWQVLNAPLQATVSTISLQDYVNQQFTQLEADTATLRNDVDTAVAQVQTLQGQVGDILQADAWVATTTYPKGDLVQYSGQLFRSLIDGNLNHQPVASTTDANWGYIGNYASLGEAVGANAANVATLQNTVTQQGNAITANSQSITQNAAAITNKADASALSATNTTVTQQGNSITAVAQDVTLLGAHNAGKTAFVLNQGTVQVDGAGTTLGQYITGVQAANTAVNARVDSEQTARANGDAANASNITSVSARVGAVEQTGLNYIPNPTGRVDTSGWFLSATAGTAPAFAAVPNDGQGPYFVMTQYMGGGAVYVDSVPIRVSANTTMTLSGYMYADGQLLSLEPYQQDSTSTFIGGLGSKSHVGGWGRESLTFTTASNAAYVVVRIIARGSFNLEAWKRLKLEVGSVATPYTEEASNAATASATTQLTAGTSINGTTYAAATTMVDANGRIGGTRLASNGNVSSFDILADRFSISAPNGGLRTEYSNGNWRIYDANNVLRGQWGVW